MSRTSSRTRSGRPAPGPLAGLRPTPGRWAAVVLAVAVVAVLCWFVGVPADRAWALCAVAALVVLLARVEDSGEDRWPAAPAPRTRPGRQELALTVRQLEGAGTDAGDRALVAERLRRLETARSTAGGTARSTARGTAGGTAGGPGPHDLDDLLARVRDTAGLRRPSTPPARRP